MSGTYVQCAECGKRALSVATRCPQCGHEFPPRPRQPMARPLDLRRYLALLAVAGVAAAVIVFAMIVIGRTRRTQPAPATSVAAVGPDTAMTVGSPRAGSGERRFARTWTKVRTRRSTTADIAAVLLPGDTILVDSLLRGWWRVTLDGRALGYVHQSTLETKPEAAGRSPIHR